MKKTFLFILASAVLVPTLSFAQLLNPEKINSEIKINANGNISAQNVKIVQFAGNTIYARLFWEESSIRITVKTGSAASITKKYGEPMAISDMKIGDRINVEGSLESGTDNLTVIAKTIKNLSDEKQAGRFSGTITGNSPSGFLLKTTSGETITLSMNSSVVVEKGNRRLGYYDVRVGDRVLDVEGVLNHANKTLDVKKIKIFIDLSVFKPRNYQGTLKALSGTELPTTATVTVGGKDYTVKLGSDAVVLNNKRYSTKLSRFVIGDTVRFYGEIPEGDEMTLVMGEVIRNVDL